MRELSPFNFGLVVAYLVPGLVILWGISYSSPIVRAWLAAPPDSLPTVGGLLYVTVVSLAAGMTASAFRWALLDTFHHATGVTPPAWNFAILQEKLEAFQTLIEIHYRYYQTHANLLVALVFAYAMRFRAAGWPAYRVGGCGSRFPRRCRYPVLRRPRHCSASNTLGHRTQTSRTASRTLANAVVMNRP